MTATAVFFISLVLFIISIIKFCKFQTTSYKTLLMIFY